MWSYNEMVEQFEETLRIAELECMKGRHWAVKHRMFNPGHVTGGYLCDRCYYKFIRDWNTLFYPHAGPSTREAIKEFMETIKTKLVEFGIEAFVCH